MSKLLENEVFDIQNFVTMEESKPVLRLLQLVLQQMEQEVLSLPLSSKEDEVALVYAKLRAQGARTFVNRYTTALEQLRTKK